MPSDIYEITKTVKEKFPKNNIAIHCHNDTGCAVASSMLAVEAGATQVQGTFTGIGERCGNADLSVIIPNLKLKYGYECNGELEMLFDATRKIAEISNVSIENNKPYTGISAFAHKGGMHIDGVLKLSRSFENIEPSLVGNKRKFLMYEVSGLLGTYSPHFKLILYKTMGEFPVPKGGMPASATIKVEVDGQEEMTAALGNGPVNALDLALRKALTVFYPQIGDMQLTDYKVRVLEQNSTTDARVRVLMDTSDGKNTWTTVGVSNDILEASLIALVDSLEYKLALS